MRRSRVVSYIVVAVALATGTFIVLPSDAGAETANPEIAWEGWFARNKPRAPGVDIPCLGQPICGPVNAGEQNAPQAVEKGAYVVSSAGGNATDSADPYGDMAWATFQWELFNYTGASVDKFVVTLTQAPDKRNDTYDTRVPGATPPPIQACNIATEWGAAAGSNPWIDRPKVDFLQCVTPTVAADKFTFELTSMAQSWVDGKGFGVAIVPGTPTTRTNIPPFQLTFSGYNTMVATPANVIPKVDFQYTPALEDDFGGGFGGGEEFFEEVFEEFGGGDTGGALADLGGEFAADPGLDIIPIDVGSDPLPELAGEVPSEEAAPVARPRTRRAGAETGFPLIAWLLLPLAAIAFWGTGTALGPLGEPVPARRGGVSRVLAAREATHRSDPTEQAR